MGQNCPGAGRLKCRIVYREIRQLQLENPSHVDFGKGLLFNTD